MKTYKVSQSDPIGTILQWSMKTVSFIYPTLMR